MSETSSSDTPRLRLTVLADEPGPARERGLRDMYLRELRFQGLLALGGLQVVLHPTDLTKQVPEDVWGAIQQVLAAVAIVSRLLVGDDIRGDADAKEFARGRGEWLRNSLEVEDESPLLDRRLRNHIEHVDQRLDDVARDKDLAVIVDRFITTGQRLVVMRAGAPVERAMLRELAPADGFVAFKGDAYDLFALRSELRRLDGLVERLLSEPVPHSRTATQVSVRFTPWGRVDSDGVPIQGDPYS